MKRVEVHLCKSGSQSNTSDTNTEPSSLFNREKSALVTITDFQLNMFHKGNEIHDNFIKQNPLISPNQLQIVKYVLSLPGRKRHAWKGKKDGIKINNTKKI